jgi:hypothetical protein
VVTLLQRLFRSEIEADAGKPQGLIVRANLPVGEKRHVWNGRPVRQVFSIEGLGEHARENFRRRADLEIIGQVPASMTLDEPAMLNIIAALVTRTQGKV